jgi:serine/threonine protein kinase
MTATPADVVESPLAPGTMLGDKYRIGTPIGQGAMGIVYEGENIRLRRRVAIKVLNREAGRDRDIVDRFEREARAAARVGSNHVVEVLDIGDTADGAHYMVMELLEGESLHARLRDPRTMPPNAIVDIVLQLLEGLEAVHGAGIVHRDLKPANVFLCRSEHGVRVKLLDFGICKFYAHTPEGIVSTGSGKILGTPGYMAPEQLGGERVDARTDIYSVGVILYRALVGASPFQSENLADLLLRIRSHRHIPIEEASPKLEVELCAIVRRAMAREPAERFDSAHALLEALKDWTTKRRRVGNLVAEFLDTPAEPVERPRGVAIARIQPREPGDAPKRVAEGFDVTVHDQSPFGADDPGTPTPQVSENEATPRVEEEETPEAPVDRGPPSSRRRPRPPSDFSPTVEYAHAKKPGLDDEPTPRIIPASELEAGGKPPASARGRKPKKRKGSRAPGWVGLFAVLFFVVGGLLVLWSLARR